MKLQRQSKSLLFHQLVRKKSMSSEKLIRFMLTSKSNASIVRQFLNGSTIEYWEIKVDLKGPYKTLSIPTKNLITILKLLRPQHLKLSIYLNVHVARLKRLLPYLEGVTRLLLRHVDPKVVECLYGLLPQLSELECGLDKLILPNFPILNLEKLIINQNIGKGADKMLSIFHHNVRVLRTLYEPIENREIPFINKTNVGKASIEQLILSVKSTPIVQNLSPLIINYCEHLPKLKKVNIEISQSFSSNTPFGSQFVEMCDEIMSFKDQVKHLLLELTVDLSIEIEVDENEEYRLNLEILLSKAKQFGDVFVSRKDNSETIDLSWIEKAGEMVFKFNLKVTLTVR